ncbi:MAG: cysteine desulfurase [Phycisphaerae bacterium]|nr:cysteine desulfurase [Phycisphaerae bacterium]
MIYLDYNATTPIDPRVVDAMIPYLREIHGNAYSPHIAGRAVRAAVVRARGQVAAMLGAEPDEIVFTSGGTEANNHVLKGVAHAFRDRSNRTIITSVVEHPAIHEPCRFLADAGVKIVKVPVDGQGLVDSDEVRRAITPDTILISIMHANNEVGTIQPIREIAAIAREAGVLMHTDAAQSIGKIPVDVEALGVDLLSAAGHKFYAPQGVGALYIREGVDIEPLIHGAGHEKGRRAGTEAVPAIVGLGMAAEIVCEQMRSDANRRICELRDLLHRYLSDAMGKRITLNGHPTKRLPNTLNVSFSGQIGLYLLEAMEDLCFSVGAACHSDADEPSAVLSAMGVPREVAMGAVRFSLGRPTTEEEINGATKRVLKALGVNR